MNYCLRKIRNLIITVVGVFCVPIGGWAADSDVISDITVTRSGSNLVYTVSRNNASAATLVNYRTMDGSAVGGIHFTHESGQLYFKKDVKTMTVSVPVLTPTGIDMYGNVDRTVGFVAWNDFSENRYVETSLSNAKSYTFNGKERDLALVKYKDSDGWEKKGFELDDDWVTKKEVAIDCFNAEEQNYFKSTGQNWKYYFRLTFYFDEWDDGCFSMGISDKGYYSAWNRNNKYGCSLGENLFAACFEDDGPMEFPVCTGGTQHAKASKSGAVVDNKYIVVPATTAKLYTTWDAGGDNNDDGFVNTPWFHVKYVDKVAPTAKAAYCNSTYSYSYGDVLTVAVKFDELVYLSTTANVTLKTNVGSLQYMGGAGTNVLYFKGVLSHNMDEKELVVQSINAQVKDQVGNLKDCSNLNLKVSGFFYKYSQAADFNYTADIWNKSINLSWLTDSLSKGQTGNWYLYRYKISDGPAEIMPVLYGPTNGANYADADKKLLYDKDYEYLIRFVPEGWDLKKMMTDRYKTVTAMMKRNFKLEIGLVSSADHIQVNWSNSKFADKETHYFQIYRKKGDANSTEPLVQLETNGITVTDNTVEHYTYQDKNIESPCATYSYRVETSALFIDDSTSEGVKYQSEFVSGTLDSASHIVSLDASKGMYAETVKLSWEAKQIGTSETGYTLYRRELGSDNMWAKIHAVSGTQNKYSYDDNTALPGRYYQYKVESSVYCDETGSENITASAVTDGFCRATGVVAGRVTYGTGTAVNGAKVSAILNSTDQVGAQFYALRVKNDKGGVSLPLSDTLGKQYFVGKPWSFQLYVNPDDVIKKDSVVVKKSMLIYSPNNFGLYLRPNGKSGYSLGFVLPNGSASVKDSISSLVIPSRLFTHLTFSYDGNKTFQIRCVDKEGNISSATCAASVASHFIREIDSVGVSNLIIGGDPKGECLFQGYLDEVRLFSGRELTNAEILKNYNRILAGNESDLVLYWPMDEGINKQVTAYDYSKTSGITNNNHGEILSDNETTASVIPTKDQLGLFGICDEYGNYTINGIPFSGEGSSYMITPSLGVHKFSPKYATRFISASSLVHSGVDFEDVSSFPVTGVVTYYNTNFPVEGASFYVDETVCSKNGEIITSDVNGEFTISVPIGAHHITVKKDNHVFVSGGRWPENPLLEDTFDMSKHIVFYDSTFVTLTGRVSGGVPESEKPHGFGMGKATIGKATIVLTSGDRYQFNTDSLNMRTFACPSDSIASVATTGLFDSESDSRKIVIHTDSATGEFAVSLPPLDYKVNSVKVDNNEDVVFSLDDIEDILFATGDLRDQTDSLVKGPGDTLTFTYKYALDQIHYSTPVLEMTSYSTKDGAFGDEKYIYMDDKTGVSDTIPLYTVDSVSGNISYTFGYPLFTQGRSYEQEMYLYEPYVNKDSDEVRITQIPLSGAEVEVSNSLGATEVAIENGVDEDGKDVKDGDVIKTGNSSLVADSLGKLTYKFQATYPNIVSPYTLGMEINFVYNNQTFAWSENGNFLGIVTGGLQTGSNFITTGPDKVLFVLRDPPGTSSSAYLEKGQSISTSSKVTMEYNSEYSATATFMFGTDVATSSGFGVALITEENVDADVSAGTEITYDNSHERENKYTLTTTENISTSDASNYVGADGDLFMGSSTNIIMGKARKVAPVRDTAGGYEINMFEAICLGEKFTTHFNYSQNYIENVLIPNFEDVRNSVVRVVSDAEYNDSYPNVSKGVVFISKVGPDDEHFAESGYYKMIKPKDEVDYMDTVAFYNTQISLWKVQLALNEAAKVKAIETNLEYSESAYNAAVKKFEEAKLLENTRYELFDPYVQHYVKLDSTFWFNKKGGLIKYADYGSNYAMINNILEGYSISRDEYEKYLSTPSGKRDFTLFYDTDKYGWKVKNLSFDSGTNIEESVQRCGSSASTDVSTTKGLAVVGGKTGFAFCGIGMTVEAETKQGGTESFEESSETENCTTVGFTLAEDGDDDALSIDVFQAPDGFGPIFYTRAGQTTCPYEDEKRTKFYEPDEHVLATKTMQIELPRITVGEGNLKFQKIIDVPSGSAANFTLNLDNLSETSENVWYRLYVVDDSNADGAALSIDGVPFSTARATLVNALETTHKNLQIRQSRQDVMKYDSIAVVLASDCQYDGTDIWEVIADTVYLSVEFVPSCSPLTLQIENKVMNTSTHDTLQLVVKDYEKDYLNFGEINLQYKGERDNDWNLVEKLLVDSLDGATAHIFFPMPSSLYNDQTYQFRAVSVCASGTNTKITNESEIVEVVKDMERPVVLGNPNPSDGILNAGDEISVTFNENIRNSMLSKGDNFIVQGVLNDAEVDHNVALKLDSSAGYIAQTEADIFLANKSFSVDMWVYLSGAGVLLNHASSDGSFLMGVDSERKLTFNVNGEVIVSEKQIPFNQWSFLTFNYSVGKDSSLISALVAYDDNQVKLFTDKRVPTYGGSGKISVGKGVKGAISEMTLWNTDRPNDVAQAQMHFQKSASTDGLVGYWKFNEGQGKVAKDVARSRNMVLTSGSWYLNNTNYAAKLSGQSYVNVDISRCNALTTDDYMVEMFFRGEPQKNATLWSANQKVALKFNAGGYLTLLSDGKEEILSSGNYLNNVWHHIALNVLRNGMTTVYVDGETAGQISSSKVAALQAPYLTVGAQRYIDNDTTKLKDYFKGDVDEVRYWLATFNGKAIEQFSHMRLNGDEAGLQAYYPFEGIKADAAGGSYVFNLNDCSVNAAGMAATNSVEQSATAPALRPKARMSDVAYGFVSSERTVTITLNESAKRLEGTTINFTVKNVRDENNNFSLPVTWSAFVNQNRLLWADEAISLVKDGEENAAFSATISNQGSSTEAWSISGLPSWLTADKTSGSLDAQKTQTISFKVNDAVAVGKYEEVIYLSGNEGLNVPFTLSLKVTKNTPAWSVDPSLYEGSMSLLSQLKIDGKYVDNAEDLVAAFVNGKCVGLASPVYYPRYDAYFVSMDIYGNSDFSKRNILFKAWDASTGIVYSALETSEDIVFEANTLKGTMGDPVILSTASYQELALPLKKGWNWISLNVKPFDNSVKGVFGDIAPENNLVKSQLNVAYSDGEDYMGSLSTISVGSMYKVNMMESSTLSVVGAALNLSEEKVIISKGWNWIGNNSTSILSLNQALAGLNPVDGDLIKGQSGFAYYEGYEWVGTLTSLVPGSGYMYYSQSDSVRSFSYPSVSIKSAQGMPMFAAPKAAPSAPAFKTVDAHAYSGNMTVVAVVNDKDTLLKSYEVGVFSGDECRASANANAKGMVFLTIAGDAETSSDSLVFKVMTGGEERVAVTKLAYSEDANYGSLSNPFVINMDSPIKESLPEDTTVTSSDPSGKQLLTASKRGVKIVAVVMDDDSILANRAVGAFVDGKCVTAGSTDKSGRITFSFVADSMDLIRFKMTENDGEIESVTRLYYAESATYGSEEYPFVIQMNPGNGLLNVAANAGLLVYPTLVETDLFVKSGSMDVLGYTIWSVSGVAYKKDACRTKNVAINVSDLQNGEYVLLLETSEGDFYQLFTKK